MEREDRKRIHARIGLTYIAAEVNIITDELAQLERARDEGVEKETRRGELGVAMASMLLEIKRTQASFDASDWEESVELLNRMHELEAIMEEPIKRLFRQADQGALIENGDTKAYLARQAQYIPLQAAYFRLVHWIADLDKILKTLREAN